MLQSINLYSDALKPKRDWLSLNLFTGYIGSVLLVLLVISAVDLWDRQSLVNSVTAREVAIAELELQIQELEQLIEARAKDPALEAQKDALEQVQKDKLTLRRFLDQEVPGNADGFSAYLADLARFHVRGLRLTEISLLNGGADVRLGGEVISGDYITNYIAGLDRSVLLAGKAFRNLKLDRTSQVIQGLPDGQALAFEIQTGEAISE